MTVTIWDMLGLIEPSVTSDGAPDAVTALEEALALRPGIRPIIGFAGDNTVDDTAAISAVFADLTATTDWFDDGANGTLTIGMGRLRITDSLIPPNSCSHVTVTGVGKCSTEIVWDGGNAEMMKFVNARNVEIKNLTLTGNANPAKRPTYGVRCHRAAGQVGAAGATDLRLTNVGIGVTGDVDGFDVAVGFSADTGQDTNNDLGTFDKVDIQNVKIGYQFPNVNTLWHVIIGGNIGGCSVACIDNTPADTLGGNYKSFGTRFGTAATSGTIFRVGSCTGLNGIDIYGMQTEGAFSLIETPTGATPTGMRFFGGHANCQDPGTGDTIKWDSSSQFTALEFHGFQLASPTGVRFHFPTSGTRVVFVGGSTTTAEWKYNCNVYRDSTAKEFAGAPTFTNLGSGVFRGHVHVVGASGLPAFQHSWTNMGGGTQVVVFWMDNDDVVRVAGFCAAGTIGQSIFTLPVGFRPAAIVNFAGETSPNAYATLQANIDGTIAAINGNNSYVCLDGISFKAA